VLEAIDADRWLVLDEMNRANPDRALGPLFTVLSGQAVVLPLEQDGRPIRIRPVSVAADPAYRGYVVQPGWRIVATTNVLDRAPLAERDRAEDLVGRLLALTRLRPLGPALFIDAARYVAAYVAERPDAGPKPDADGDDDAFGGDDPNGT
jgi:hypothetical protein